MAAEKKSTLDERIARAKAELDAKHGPGPFDCQFCGVATERPCAMANCMRCQNFGYYPPGAARVGEVPKC